MTDAEINKIVSKLLHEKLEDIGFQRSIVESEQDFDGSSIIRATAHFKEGSPPSDRLINALHDIRSELLRKGEERFVLLDSEYPHDEAVDEDVE